MGAENVVIDTAIGTAIGEDAAAITTDIMIDELTDALVEHFAKAYLELREKNDKYLSKFEKLDQTLQADLAKGKITKEQYAAWQKSRVFSGKNWEAMKNVIAEDIVHKDEIAASMINDKKIDVYALNHNFGTYEIEKGSGMYTSYTLYNHDSVARLIQENPQLLPPNKVPIAKDKLWNLKHLNNAVTQGILQGDSISGIAKRMAAVTDMNKNSAIRNARTAMTGAQNAGRQHAYERAENLGIDTKRIWISTLDGRTRHEHRALMGQKRGVDKPFSIGPYEIMYPGDPHAAPEMVYNCRCTTIASVDHHDYHLEDRMKKHLKEKGEDYDEWVMRDSFPRHYNERLGDYLDRYSKHLESLKFSDWLMEQALPDALIQAAWGNKKYGYVYNLLKNAKGVEGHGADANNFFYALKDLGQKSGIGNPPNVWKAYMTGQLDAEDLKTFEEIIKKYLPTNIATKADDITEAVKAADKALDTAKVADKAIDTAIDEIKTHLPVTTAGLPPEIYSQLKDLDKGKIYSKWRAGEIADSEIDDIVLKHKANVDAQIAELEAKIKWEKGPEMSFDNADNFHVNPNYTTNSGIYSINCQTCAFDYEARRQGYDVVVLGKDTSHKGIYKLQDKLAQDQGEGWINRYTGRPPQKLLKDFGYDEQYSTSKFFDSLENVVGHNGERYTLSIRWKSSGAHIINMDRDENGVLRLIDNQRGKHEKHIWTGEAEIKKYFESVGSIIQVYRVDDCIPNPKFFNMIVKKADTSIGDLAKLKATGKATKLESVVKATTAISKSDLPKYYDIDANSYVKVKSYLKNKGLSGADRVNYYESWKKGKISDPKLDEIFGFTGDQGVNFIKIDLSQLQGKTWSQVYNELKANSGSYGMLYNHLKKFDPKAEVAWQKYLAGEIDDSKIDDLLLKFYEKNPSQLTTAASTIVKTDLPDDLFNVPADLKSKFVDFADNNYKALGPTQVYEDWKAGKLKDSDIDKLFGISATTPTTATAVVSPIDTAIDFDAIKDKTWSQVYTDLKNNKGSYGSLYTNLKKHGDAKEVWEKYLKGELKDDKIDKILAKSYPAKTTSPITTKSLQDIIKDKKYDNDFMAELGNKLQEINIANGHPGSYDTWGDYLAGKLSAADTKAINDIISKDITPVVPTPKASVITKADLPDAQSLVGKQFDDVYDTLNKKGISGGDMTQHFNDWKADKIYDPDLDKLFGVKSTPPAATTTTVDFNSYKKKSMSDVLYNEMKPSGQYSSFYKTLKEIGDDTGLGSQSKVWKAWQDGKLSDADAKKIEKFLGGGKIAPTKKASTPTLTPEQQKKLDDAKQVLGDTKKKLEDAKKKLPPDKTYSGIWKDDVTLADYESKKDKIAAKKIWFEDEIEKYEIHIDGLEDWEIKKLEAHKQHLKDLDEFDKLGAEYLKYKKEIDKIQDEVKAAQDEVTKLSPAGEMYTQTRKDNAKWFTKKAYRSGDAYYTKQATQVHATATSAEHSAYYGYTSASGSYNRPLAGFESPQYSGANGWDEKYFKGVGNVPLNNEGSGKKIRDLTSFIEKSKMEDDIWVQTAQNFATLEGKQGFLGVPYGALKNMSDAELQQFVGVENQFGQFISGSINRGGGSYTPGSMRINIYCPKGSEALYVLEDGAFGKSEHEIILQRGGTYRITKIYWGQDVEQGGRCLMVDMELRLENGYNKYEK